MATAERSDAPLPSVVTSMSSVMPWKPATTTTRPRSISEMMRPASTAAILALP